LSYPSSEANLDDILPGDPSSTDLPPTAGSDSQWSDELNRTSALHEPPGLAAAIAQAEMVLDHELGQPAHQNTDTPAEVMLDESVPAAVDAQRSLRLERNEQVLNSLAEQAQRLLRSAVPRPQGRAG